MLSCYTQVSGALVFYLFASLAFSCTHKTSFSLSLSLSLSLSHSLYIYNTFLQCTEQLLTFISGYVKHFIYKYSVYTKRGPSSIKGPLSGAR